MSAGNTDASRAEFEAWYRLEYTNHIYFQDGKYDKFGAELAWKSWQASRKAALSESIARVAQCMGPRSGAETAIKELLG